MVNTYNQTRPISEKAFGPSAGTRHPALMSQPIITTALKGKNKKGRNMDNSLLNRFAQYGCKISTNMDNLTLSQRTQVDAANSAATLDVVVNYCPGRPDFFALTKEVAPHIRDKAALSLLERAYERLKLPVAKVEDIVLLAYKIAEIDGKEVDASCVAEAVQAIVATE